MITKGLPFEMDLTSVIQCESVVHSGNCEGEAGEVIDRRASRARGVLNSEQVGLDQTSTLGPLGGQPHSVIMV